jgi:desulfoferrodoxin (superoxide reductase-like protein)
MVNPPQANSSPTDKSGAFRKQIIDAATTKLNQTAKVMETVTENYQKASDKLVDVQLKIGELQAELATLQAANINLVRNHTHSPNHYIKWICVRRASLLTFFSFFKIYRTKLRPSSSSASTSSFS